MDNNKLLENAEIETTVYSTYKYDLFKFQGGNRVINEINLQKISKSSAEKQMRIPIIINEKNEIIDGQHRFLSWVENNKPIYFIINEGYGLEETKRANIVSANWTIKDFLETYCYEEKYDYLVFKKFVKHYNISENTLLSLFARFQKKNENILKEIFILGNFSCYGANEVKDFLNKLQLFNNCEFYNKSGFIKAFLEIYLNEKYDHDNMQKQFLLYGHNIKKQVSVNDYISEILNNVYNFRKTKNRIEYHKERNKFYTA
jgi:hypothetical protein